MKTKYFADYFYITQNKFWHNGNVPLITVKALIYWTILAQYVVKPPSDL
jgi:hypothetical protein